tara:strand:- start:621 stop:2147 length:1527 start_codon:yes stop_codon:yes gene_type:complete
MIKRYFATKDNTITNAFEPDMTTRGTGSNMGQSDILEVFTIYGQASSSSGLQRETANILLQFNASQIATDKTSGAISSGSSFYLKMFNARHSQNLPRDFSLEVLDLTESWQEGLGLNMENYSDLTYDIRGSNWIMRSGSQVWGSEGSPESGGASGSIIYPASFPIGNENLEIDITSLVNQWVDASKDNNGVVIRMSSSLAEENRSYYTKMFFGRNSHNWFERPVLEARWDSATTDDRGAFHLSSSLVTAEDNINTIYLYNYARGRLTNIPSVNTDNKEIMVSIFSGSSDNTGPSGSALQLVVDANSVVSTNDLVVTGGWVSKGIYSASFAYTGSSAIENVYDVWFSGSNSVLAASGSSMQFSTGSIEVKRFSSLQYSYTPKYVFAVSNKNQDYYHDQVHRIRLYAREKNWSPNIYTTATTVPNSLIFNSASYQVSRVVDNKIVIPYNTSSTQATRLSYDVSGNYFDLDCSIFEPNYQYGIKFSIYDPDTLTYEEQPFTYNLRVVKNES